MKPSSSRKYSPRWYQQPISEILGQALQFVLSTFLAAGKGVLGCWKKPVALALVIITPLLVIACHCAAVARVTSKQPAHLKEIMDELSSIRIPTGKPVSNHADTKLLYVKYTKDDTWGLYLLDIASRKISLVREIITWPGQSEYVVLGSVKIIGWSPDDKYFAYTRDWNKEIAVCDGDSGTELAKRSLKSYESYGSYVPTGAWLSSQRLLYSDGVQIYEFTQSPGDWLKTLFYESPQKSKGTDVLADETKPPVDEIKSLAAFSWNSAVWQQSNAIYVGEKGRAPEMIWQATNSTLLEFSFSFRAGKFLLHCKDDEGEFLADFYPRMLSGKDTLTNIVRLDTRDYHPHQATLINNGDGYAYIDYNDVSLSKLVIKITNSSPPVPLPWHDQIGGFSINGLQLYAICSSTNEPAGIWKYDLVSGALDCLVSSVEQPFKYAATAPVLEGYVTNATGEQLIYYILQPTGFAGNKKHPLVIGIMGIGEMGYTWDRLAQTVASCGAYFMCMDRRGRDGQDQWAEDALCAYEFLSQHFDVDTNNVYFLGISAGAGSANYLLESKPNLWKVAILFSTHSFPTSDKTRVQSVSLDVGAKDFKQEELKALLKSQDESAAAGIRPTLTVHPGAGHIVRSIPLDKERMRQIAAFIRQP